MSRSGLELADAARQLVAAGRVDEAATTGLEAVDQLRTSGEYGVLFELTDELLAHVRPAVGPSRALRGELARAHAESLLRTHRAGDAESFLQEELSSSENPYTVEEQLPLLSLQAAAAHSLGNEVRTQRLIAEAVGLSAESQSETEVQSTALALAIRNADLDAMHRLSSNLAELAPDDAGVDLDVRFAEVFTMIGEGQYDDADLLAEGLYLDARRADDHYSACRAIYIRAAIEGTQFGMSDRCIEFAEQAVWFIEQRLDSDRPSVPLAALFNIGLQRGRVDIAEATLERLAGFGLSGEALYTRNQLSARLALYRGDLAAASSFLTANDVLEADFPAPQYRGIQLLLSSELGRRSGNLGRAIDASAEAARLVIAVPNDALVRDVVLEACRAHADSGMGEQCRDWIHALERSQPANAAYAQACDAIVSGRPADLIPAAETLASVDLGYEGLQCRLKAVQLESRPDPDLAQAAESAGATWIAAAALMNS